MKLALAVVVVWSSVALAQPKQAPVKVVSPTIAPPPVDVGTPITVPALPTFELSVPPSGNHSPQELIVNGRSLLGTQVMVEGTITWIYECVDAVRKKGQSKAQAQRMIDSDPTLCERKKFFLGDDKTTPPERALWVVDVPRPPNKLERERLPKDEIKNWPKVPKLAVGDRVVVSGTFSLSSPHSERNSDGLIVFASIAPLTSTAAPSRVSPPSPPPASPLVRKKLVRPPRSIAASNKAIKLAADGTKAYALRQYDTAIAAYEIALREWDGHHFAWYGMAGAYIGKGDWARAVEAIDHAVSLAPDAPMYQLVYGVAIYESIVAAERAAEATRQGAPDPDRVEVDTSKLDFRKALPPLLGALQLEPKLWRAHYYLGRIYRDGGYPAAAAAAFRDAIADGALTTAPFIALAELYRRWGFAKEATEIALLGTARFTGSVAADLWFVLGMSYYDQRENKLAIQAYTQALAADRGYEKALFQRGQSYFQLKDKKAAKADLEAFVKRAGADRSFTVQQANKMLMDLAATR